MSLFGPEDDRFIADRAANRDAMASAIIINPFESMIPYGGVNGGQFIVNGVAMSEKDLEQFSQRCVDPTRFNSHDLREAELEELVSNGTIFTDPNVNPYDNLDEAVGILPDPYCTVSDLRPDEVPVPDPRIPMLLSIGEPHEEKDTNADDGGHNGEIEAPSYRMGLHIHPDEDHIPDHGIPMSFSEMETRRRQEKNNHGSDDESHGVDSHGGL